MNKRVVIVHGSFGNSRENWFPWLAKEVEQQDHLAIVPDFPTPENQSLHSWLSVFQDRVGALTADTVLVGHSLGVAFILRVLERSQQSISGTLLVSGFLGELGLPEFDSVNSDFVLGPVDWKAVTRNAGRVTVFHSDSDPYVPLSKGQEIAKHLGARIVVLRNAGHINSSAGFQEFPQLLKEIEKLL